MEKPLWKFSGNQGTFISEDAHKVNTLYFPLANSHPFMSSITPDLHGDIKTDNNHFLLEPVSRPDLRNSRSSRNFWIYVNPRKVWSATGVSKDINAIRSDKFSLEAGILWHKVTRRNARIGLEAEITSFVPAGNEPVEIMRVTLTNISQRKIRFTATSAIPVFGRSANRLRDHRHVSSLLNRVRIEKHGVIATTSLFFDESGHRKDRASYFVLGTDEKSRPPQYIYASQDEFCGEGGDLEAPEAVLKNMPPRKNSRIQGKEVIGALRFRAATLAPGKSRSYIIVMGITEDSSKIPALFGKFNTTEKTAKSLRQTDAFWQERSGSISLDTSDKTFDNWFRWVNIQPILRKIFGCSFLPDFDYGKGGRGWRDLWQDCLSLTLLEPRSVRPLLVSNFAGVRIDGSNATIIGAKPGEFIADRNDISRVWMDHGTWPLITTHLYLNQSGDFRILLEDAPYFRDRQLSRSSLIDRGWKKGDGNKLKTRSGKIYLGSILEHLLVENLVQFFNVGAHNCIRLEGADWNDGLDMAAGCGESVAFSCLYAQNLKVICEILERSGLEKLSLMKELLPLLDTLAKPLDYDNAAGKRKLLEKYFSTVNQRVTGKKITIPVGRLIKDIGKKAEWLSQHIRKKEWLREGFFNGYYNDDGNKLEGIKGTARMTLTGQVFPLMSGIATAAQVKAAFASAKKHLQDPAFGGFRLNTDFKSNQLNMGRAFSFSYGDKENGAFFNHMAIMFAYALYKRGFVKEGFEVLDSIYRMAVNSRRSRIYPCLPEYFNGEGRGMYSYLTGSASWMVFTFLTEVFGVKGSYGDLMIEPKLTALQFKDNDGIAVKASFLKRSLEIRFINKGRKDFGSYRIRLAKINGSAIKENNAANSIVIPRRKFLSLTGSGKNIIEIILD
ncbi:MAG: cellobiose phosphorylase [Candidatus Omnitrophota bacterium]